MKLTNKEKAELARLNRKILLRQKVTRKQVMRAFDLQRKRDAHSTN